MINQQAILGNWNEIKGKLRSKWGSLTDDDLQCFRGDVDQLIGGIQRKTGEARESIERFFEDWSSDSASAVSRAAESVRNYTQQATEAVQRTSEQAAASVRNEYDEVERMVRHRPAQSLAICFGMGVLTGVVACLFLSRR